MLAFVSSKFPLCFVLMSRFVGLDVTICHAQIALYSVTLNELWRQKVDTGWYRTTLINLHHLKKITMKKICTSLAALLIAVFAQAQVATLVSPEGLTPPYEVSPGTEVTVAYDFWGDEPVALTHNEEPDLTGFGLDPAWNEYSGLVNNGDGTFSFTFTANEEIWVWGGFYMPFLMNWNFSNIIHIAIASDVLIDADVSTVCGDGSDAALLSVEDIYDSYQWYLNNEIIIGATANTYSAEEAGAYKVEVEADGEFLFSNTVQITAASIAVTGAYVQGSAEFEMTASAGFDSYQWWSGPDAGNLTEIDGATDQSYLATLEENEVFYSVTGTMGSCTVTSPAQTLSAGAFITPEIIITAETNDLGNICDGTQVMLSVEGSYESYAWYKDDFEEYGEMSEIYLYGSFQAGSYTVEVSPEGWPDVILVSEPVDVSFTVIISPNLIVSPQGPYCPGTEVTVLLGDEGYDYTWYVHSGFSYSEEDEVDVAGYSYSFEFEQQTNVTVVASAQGCTESSSVSLNAAGDAFLSISLVNWDQQYLCTDSTAVIQVSPWNVDDFSDFQWYQEVDGTMQPIEGANESQYGATTTGVYAVEAAVVGCEDVLVMSGTMEIYGFDERDLFIFADNELLCMGEETMLNISGGWEWTQIQWFEREIQMGAQGYEEVFVPMISGGSSAEQMVDEFNYYQVKARHQSCPTGVKITSNTVSIRPLVNPSITVDPDYGVESLKPSPYGDIAVHLYCSGEPVNLSVPDNYENYSWHQMGYTGDGGYYLGDATPGESQATTTVEATGADWVTAQVDSAGCIGVSDPILIDTWVFQNPAIASYNNAEICQPGDSALIHIAFQGNYEYIEWYNYDQLIPGENNDSLWVTEPGMYIVTVYREECPQFGLSSGVGPIVTFLEPYIVEQEDLIYAMPHEGFYEFQWYLDGEPFEAPAATPWILYKADMPAGEYTVEVTNPEPCTAITAPFNWIISSVNEHEASLGLYPNPTNGELIVSGLDMSLVESVRILDVNGRLVHNAVINGNRLHLESMARGMFIVEIAMNDGAVIRRKVLKN